MAAIPTHEPITRQSGNSQIQPVLSAVAEAIGRLRFGTVQLVVHEGKVVQLDVTDRIRFR